MRKKNSLSKTTNGKGPTTHNLLKDFLTVRDLLNLFQVTPMTLRAWRLHHALPSYRLGPKITLFYKPEILAWAHKNDKTLHELPMGSGS